MKPQTRRESGHPVLDETAFQQLLSAAYVMQEHNSRLKKAPQPASVANTMKAPVVVAPSPVEPVVLPNSAPAAGSTCRECGTALALHEFFCESCGAPAERPNNTMQKNWASLWEMHQASQSEAKVTDDESEVAAVHAPAPPAEDAAEEDIALFPEELEEIVGKFAESGEEEELKVAKSETPIKALSLASATIPAAETAPVATWTSAAKARVWLDSLKPQQGKDWFREEWNFHRGIISIALASAVLLAVLFQWATQPAATPGQARELSGFEQLLVSVGLAEAPAPVTSAPQPGNPDTKVWVDVHTALYYCPGADLYGKTADGKYTSQLDAQRDHFQPSTLKACD